MQHGLMELTDHAIGSLSTAGRLCIKDTWTRQAGAASQASSWQDAPEPRELRTGSTILPRGSDHRAPASNDPAPQLSDNTASPSRCCLHHRKAAFEKMGITPTQIAPTWIVQTPSQSAAVCGWPKSFTPFSHWEREGSAIKRYYSVFEGNTQPETYFSFYNGLNWP